MPVSLTRPFRPFLQAGALALLAQHRSPLLVLSRHPLHPGSSPRRLRPGCAPEGPSHRPPCGLCSPQRPEQSSPLRKLLRSPSPAPTLSALGPVHWLFPLPGMLFRQVPTRTAPSGVCSSDTSSLHPLTSLFTATASPSGAQSSYPALPSFFLTFIPLCVMYLLSSCLVHGLFFIL